MALTKQKSFADGTRDTDRPSSDGFLTGSPPFPASAMVLVPSPPSLPWDVAFSSCAPASSRVVSGALRSDKKGRGTHSYENNYEQYTVGILHDLTCRIARLKHEETKTVGYIHTLQEHENELWAQVKLIQADCSRSALFLLNRRHPKLVNCSPCSGMAFSELSPLSSLANKHTRTGINAELRGLSEYFKSLKAWYSL